MAVKTIKMTSHILYTFRIYMYIAKCKELKSSQIKFVQTSSIIEQL